MVAVQAADSFLNVEFVTHCDRRDCVVPILGERRRFRE